MDGLVTVEVDYIGMTNFIYIFFTVPSRESADQKLKIFHYCVYFKFVTAIMFVAISKSFTKIDRVVFELCAKVCA